MIRARRQAETGSREPGLASRPGPAGFDPARLRAEPDPERLSCWCGGWGHFFNTAFDPPQLTFCGNCEDAKKPDPWNDLSELEKDLTLARLGDYPGAEGCRRIASAYDALAAERPAIATEARRAETENTGSVEDESAVGNADLPNTHPDSTLGLREALEAIASFERADTEFRRAKNSGEQPRLSKAGTRYQCAKWRLFKARTALGHGLDGGKS